MYTKGVLLSIYFITKIRDLLPNLRYTMCSAIIFGKSLIMLYHLYDSMQAMLAPARLMAEASKAALQNPMSPLSYHPAARSIAASAELFEPQHVNLVAPNSACPKQQLMAKRLKSQKKPLMKNHFAP